MKEKIKQLPKALQRQVLIRLAGGTVFLPLFIVVQFCFSDYYFSLPCLLLGSLMIINGSSLLYRSLKGQYICAQGICRRIETTGVRKRIKNIYIDMEPYRLKIPVRYKTRNLHIGDTVILYLSEKAPVYERDHGYMICSYDALEVRKEG